MNQITHGIFSSIKAILHILHLYENGNIYLPTYPEYEKYAPKILKEWMKEGDQILLLVSIIHNILLMLFTASGLYGHHVFLKVTLEVFAKLMYCFQAILNHIV